MYETEGNGRDLSSSFTLLLVMIRLFLGFSVFCPWLFICPIDAAATGCELFVTYDCFFGT